MKRVVCSFDMAGQLCGVLVELATAVAELEDCINKWRLPHTKEGVDAADFWFKYMQRNCMYSQALWFSD